MIEMPPELATELTRMRRDPGNFTVVSLGHCKFGDEATCVLSHPSCADAGVWCPEHGWIYFSSGQILPEWEKGKRGVQ